ncbi:hypothetical protein K402DRAFT_454754 [Aulographum hederae CBS 113979]|uniref:DUF7924 domain-containing protein n=1 Tax=Aulographum hederae CBS 113979 TaxID=1176131 RepID=A0A6G1GY94_9PEZI|nr:hypothetical protein K402DRAFT_454754 [Aulographum hederae CBS 113979]
MARAEESIHRYVYNAWYLGAEYYSLPINLLMTECLIPTGTIFDDDRFKKAIADTENKNDARVFLDITRLLVPPVASVAMIHDSRLEILTQSVNEGWENCFPLLDIAVRPQPDYAVGFERSAIEEDRLQKLRSFVGYEPSSCHSQLMATDYMFFPFLTCEVKCLNAVLAIASRQNAHSMAIAVRGIALIFKLAGRLKDLHGRVLTFSISHNPHWVNLDGWYILIDEGGEGYSIHCHFIHALHIMGKDGEERWTTRRFTLGVYQYAIEFLKEINAVIDELPEDLNLESLKAPIQPASRRPSRSMTPHLQPSTRGLVQALESQSLTEEEPLVDDLQSKRRKT